MGEFHQEKTDHDVPGDFVEIVSNKTCSSVVSAKRDLQCNESEEYKDAEDK